MIHAQKQYQESGRAMALEAGEAMHQVFAAIRCWQLHYIQRLPRHAAASGTRIFGAEKWRAIWGEVSKAGSRDRDQLATLAINTLHNSGFYDDPDDKTRTIANMELASMEYIDQTLPYFDSWPVWVADRRNPNAPVGIEQVFDVVLEFGPRDSRPSGEAAKLIRYIGTLDGIVVNIVRGSRITLAENKTASRLDRAWVESFKMRHQITGYMACGQSLFGIEMWHARIYGVKIKPTYKGEDVVIEPVERDKASVFHWANWVYRCVSTYEMYEKEFEYAPRYTHSCNRYFRPCSLIPFCADTPDGRRQQFEQMIPADKSPSERAIVE